ncbi:class I SAM-dependent methyltransferase [Actinoplanes sp. NPDC049599]|uniref:class I SAM-dependent methyltransferase n=1 Tax=Actinoplanes sp. NPDC049599 TaxID=3363903 RepID=UPI003799ABCB
MTDHHHHGPGHDHNHGHDHGQMDDDAFAEMIDLDAEVLHEYLTGLFGWLHERSGGRTRRILDVGSGSGTGTLGLAGRFPEAEITAVDLSAPMLHRVRDKARALGVADRIHTRQADLDAGWPTLEPVDLVWASASLHHLADPDRVLTDILGTLRPGGLFAVVELASFPYFLPADLGLGRPGLEERCHALAGRDVPLLGADWGPRLRKAGFTVEAERRFDIALTPPLPEATGRYAQAVLSRLRSGLDDRLDPDDRATLDTLLSGDGMLSRTDLTVRTTRTVWLAVRP